MVHGLLLIGTVWYRLPTGIVLYILSNYNVNKPAITTGIIDFMMRSGFMTAMAEIPTPDLAVPYAAPSAEI